MSYAWFVRSGYFPFVQWLKNERFFSIIRDMEKTQYVSSAERIRVQQDKMRRLVIHAIATVPFYRDRYVGYGSCIHEKMNYDDFCQLPVIDKKDIAAQWQSCCSPLYHGRKFSARTSGSTGVALQFCYDSLHESSVLASIWRGRRWWGVDIGDREIDMWGRPLTSRYQRCLVGIKQRVRNVLHLNTFNALTDEHFSAWVRRIRLFKPVLIYGYGSSIFALAAYLKRTKQEIRIPCLKLIEYTADQLFPNQIALIEEVFSVPVTSAYGASEAGGLAQQCPEGNLHISDEHILVEIVDDAGTVVPAGTPGNVVITTLNNYVMPLIRYRIGDIAALSEGTCSCGRTLPCMQLLVGKSVDIIETSSNKGFSAHFLDYLNIDLMKQGIRGIIQFKVLQTSLDDFTVRFVRDTSYNPACVQFFETKMKQYLGEQISVSFEVVDRIPQENTGKIKYFEKTFV